MPLRHIYKPEPAHMVWARWLWPYLAVAASSGVALGLTLLLPAISEKPFFVLFLAATGLCAWRFGLTPGLTSMGANMVLVWFLVFPSDARRGLDIDVLSRSFVFFVTSLLVAIAMGRLNRMQTNYRLAQERFQLAHDIARIWAWELDLATGRVLWSSNPAMDGGTHEDPVQIWLQRIFAEDREAVTQALKSAIETQKPYEVELRVIMPGGKICWFASSGEFYRARNADQRMIGVNVDITSRKEAESALEAAVKGEMADELAHQINNPLQGLTHALHLLHQQVKGPEAQEYSKIAQTEADRVSRLVHEILRLYSGPRFSQ